MGLIDQSFPQTVIIRHRRENLQKCSLRGLESRTDCRFHRYPMRSSEWPVLENYVLLALDGELLSPADAQKGLLLIDATWRYAEVMLRFVEQQTAGLLPRRTLPANLRTAYPRRQDDCPHPQQGLASIEALYAAYSMMGRATTGLLDHYYWREEFLAKNSFLSNKW